jgi:hypothetical protein
MAARRNWRTVAAVNARADPILPYQPFGSAARYEAKLWREFGLGNVAEITRRVPGWYSDEEIGEALREARRLYLLPCEYDEMEWEQITCKPL